VGTRLQATAPLYLSKLAAAVMIAINLWWLRPRFAQHAQTLPIISIGFREALPQSLAWRETPLIRCQEPHPRHQRAAGGAEVMRGDREQSGAYTCVPNYDGMLPHVIRRGMSCR